MKNLTLRIEALEAATPTAPPQAPPREEGGRANGHRVVPQYQGADGKNSSLHHTLVKGEQHLHNSSRVLDFPESSHRRDYDGSFQHKDYKLPRLYFPKFDGSHPRILKEMCEKYFPCSMFLRTYGASFATDLHFRGNMGLWSQTYEAQHSMDS